jgi:hypothetical protein
MGHGERVGSRGPQSVRHEMAAYGCAIRAKVNVASLGVLSRFEVAQGKVVEGLKVQGQKSSGSDVCEHSFHSMGWDF